MTHDSSPPAVLIIAGNDPSGGAGLAADIQTIAALAAHPAPVVTTLTVQDTRNAYDVSPVEPALVTAQARAVLADLDVKAIKLGLLGTAQIGAAVADLLDQHPDIPVVVDPVLVAAGGAQLAEQALIQVLLERLVRHATILTPNTRELESLAPGRGGPEQKAAALIERGARYVLAKGADDATADVHNVLYDQGGELEHFTWSRLPHTYHGSGCTLASAIAGLLAHGQPPRTAAEAAQRYTFEALRRGFQPGRGQYIPHRFFHLPENPKL